MIVLSLLMLSSCDTPWTGKENDQKEADEWTQYSSFVKEVKWSNVCLINGSEVTTGSAAFLEDDFAALSPTEIDHSTSWKLEITPDKMRLYIPGEGYTSTQALNFNSDFSQFSISYGGRGLDYSYCSVRLFQIDSDDGNRIYEKAKSVLLANGTEESQ
jgi:hypothetical protein